MHENMEMTEPEEGNPKYNPKYAVRLSISTNDMFPTYHSPDDATSRDAVDNHNGVSKNTKKIEVDSSYGPSDIAVLEKTEIKGDYL